MGTSGVTSFRNYKSYPSTNQKEEEEELMNTEEIFSLNLDFTMNKAYKLVTIENNINIFENMINNMQA
jgi:hypothetical protein